MPPTPGYSFAPTFDQTEERGGGGQMSPQQALEVLSFRLKPRVAGAPPSTGAGGLSPLVGQKQMGSSIGQAVLESVLRTVLGSGADQFMPGSAPAPVIHPGDRGGRGPVTSVPSPRPNDPYDREGWEDYMRNPPAPTGPPPQRPPRDFPPYDGQPLPQPVPLPQLPRPQDFPPRGEPQMPTPQSNPFPDPPDGGWWPQPGADAAAADGPPQFTRGRKRMGGGMAPLGL